MLIRFAIDPSALSLSDRPAWETLGDHVRCMKYGWRYGILIYSGAEFEKSDIWRAVEKLPQEFRTRWHVAFKKMRKRKGPPDWLGLGHNISLKDIQELCDDVQVACLEEVGAEIVGFPENEIVFQVQPNGPEIVRLSSIDHATPFNCAEAASGRLIPEGLGLDELWRDRFKDVASFSQYISIVDRYAVENFHEGKRRGLERLLKEIDGTAKGAKVRIYAGIKKYARSDLEQSVKDILLGRGGVREIEMFLVPSGQFSQPSHDRFLRFDDDVYDIGFGVGVFDGAEKKCDTNGKSRGYFDATVQQVSSFTLKAVEPLHKTTEKKLREIAMRTFPPFRHSPQGAPNRSVAAAVGAMLDSPVPS